MGLILMVILNNSKINEKLLNYFNAICLLVKLNIFGQI